MHKIVFSMRLCVLGAILLLTQLQAQNYSNNSLLQKYTKLGELDKIQVLMDSGIQSLSKKVLLSRLKNSSLLSTVEKSVYQDMLKDISARKATEFIKAIKNNSSAKSLESKSEYLKKTNDTQFLLTEYEDFIDFGGGNGWHNLDKYIYDNNLNTIEWVQQYYDSTESLVNSSLMMYLYDSFNRDTLDVNQSWDPVSQSWVDYAKWSNTFNANNYISESIYFSRSDPEWQLGGRNLYTYDANNNTLEVLNQIWEDPEWMNSSRETFTYDANNNLVADISYNWDGTNWSESFKTENTYDANNNITSYIFSFFGNFSNKDIYTYDGNNNQISDSSYNWNSNNSSWIIGFVLTSTYDANNNQTDYLVKQSNGSTLADYLKYDATFDVFNKIISWRSYTKNGSKWLPNSKGDYLYDEDQNNTLFSQYGTRDRGATWNLFRREAWTWNKVATGIEETRDNTVTDFSLAQNYPNPFNPSTKISFAIPERSNVNLQVFDLLGREVAILVNGEMEAGIHDIEFLAANLPSGIYFYKMTAGKFSQTAKMMLLK